MKKTFILIASLLLLLVSCENPVFLPNPNPVQPNNDKVVEDATLHAPRDVVAKHGMKGNIEISWKPVEDAVRYNIYRADSLFSDFVQVNEVKGNTTVYKQKKHAGFDKYYKISAVDITGKESEKSNVIRATTLAQPIINDISGQQYLEDTNIYVSWYMNNADDYIDSVTYTVYCLDNQGKEVQTRSSVGLNTNVLFEGLKPNTNYNFKVAAFNAANESEESEVVDSATAHRLKPDAVEGLVVEQGLGMNSIKLHIPLPNFVDVTVGKKMYEPRPLYFKIYRREYKETDNKEEFQYIGRFGENKVKIEDKFDYTQVYFGEGNTKVYKPGEIVVYEDKDTTLEPNKKYEYKVQSFASAEREISSDESVAYNHGWLLPTFNFTTKLEYKIIKEPSTTPPNKLIDKKTDATISMIFSMNNFEVPYKFKITQLKHDLDHKGEPIITELKFPNGEDFAKSVEEVGKLSIKIDLTKEPKNKTGYYQYKITILGPDDKEITSYTNPKEELVTDSMDVPNIGDIIITEGYTDKITIGWNWNLSCEYSLKIEDVETNKVVETINFEDLEKYMKDQLSSVQKPENNLVPVVYTDSNVKPGSNRKYVLTMKLTGNLDNLKKDSTIMEAQVPFNPVITPRYFYDKISISTKNIDRANSTYMVTPSFINTNEYTNKYRLELVEPEKSGIYEYNIVLKNPTVLENKERNFETGILGEPVKITINEKRKLDTKTYNDNGDVQKETLETDIQDIAVSQITASVGPALLNTKVSKRENTDRISVSWNKVIGANGYLIYRDRYYLGPEALISDLELKTETAELYKAIINLDGTIKVYSDNVALLDKNESIDNYVKIDFNEKENKYTLQDIYRPLGNAVEGEEGYPWKKGQSEIVWGAPYKYTIIPIIDENDIEKISKNKEDVVTVGFDQNTQFNIINPIDPMERMGGTIGYGWNVNSSKGTYGEMEAKDSLNQFLNNSIRITWSTPFFANPKNYKDSKTFTTPSFQIFRKELAKKDEWVMLEIPINGYACVDKTAKQGTVYEYAVVDLNYNDLKPNEEFIIAQQKEILDSKNELPKAVGYTLPNPKIISASRTDNSVINGIKTDKAIDSEDIKFNPIMINNIKNYGISGYAIEVKNNNIDNNWHTIKTIPLDDSNKNLNQYVITVENIPVDSANPNGEKLLKVLRDYKHYFRIRTYIEVYSENEGKNVKLYNMLDERPEDFDKNLNSGYVTWGCRQITNEEFARAANLLITYGVHYIWQENKTTPQISYANEGKFLSLWRTGVFGFKGYQRSILTKGSSYCPFLNVTGTLNADFYGAYQPYQLRSEPINFICENAGINDLYNGTIKYLSNGKMIVTYNDEVKEYKYDDTQGNMCPLALGYRPPEGGLPAAGEYRAFKHEDMEWK